MQIDVGDIILIKNNEIDPPKRKFSLCVFIEKDNIEDDYYFLLINKENRKMYDGYKIKNEDHGFLNQDSYIGCTNLFKYSKEEILSLGYDKKSYLKYEEIKGLLSHIENSDVLTAKYKRMIVESLKEVLLDYE